MTLKMKVLENTVGTGNQHFLLFTHCFLLYQREISIVISATFTLLSHPKLLSFRKELNLSFSVINHCQDSPCKHGQCTNSLNGFTCACNRGYKGTTCNKGI